MKNRQRSLSIETPEGVVFSYRLATPVTRSLAWAVDASAIGVASYMAAKVTAALGVLSPDLANALGAAWNYTGPADVMREASALVPRFAGVSYERLEGYASQQWPVDAAGRDSRYLYAEQFAFPDGKAHFHPPKWIPPLATDREFDLYLNNGRVLEQFHWGNLTYRDAGITAKMPAMYLEVSPELARERSPTPRHVTCV